MNRFAKLAVAATTAIGIAATPITATAEPGGQDYARALAGLAILGIIANSSRDRDRARVSRDDNIRYGRIEDDRYDGRRVIRGEIERPGVKSPFGERGYKRAQLPGRCLLSVDTGRREFLAYGSRCLNKNYKFANKLPQSCKFQVRTRRGIRNVYGERCLRRDGWQVARR